jgi:hypothetical protein
MGTFGRTFLMSHLNHMSCKLMCYSMNSLKLTKALMEGCIIQSFYIFWASRRDIFSM